MMSRLVPKLRFDGFSGEWEEDKLENISNFINEKIKLSHITLNDYISTENILPNFTGIARASKLPNIINVTKFQKYDVLMSNIRPYLKKIWLANINGGASNDVIVIRAKKNNSYQFLLHIVQNDKFIDYVMQGAKGVKMPRGDISLIKKYPLALPKLLEQQKIANCLSSLDNLIESQNKKIEALKKHKKGLMQGLFPAEGEKEPKLRFNGFSGEWEEKELKDIALLTSSKRIYLSDYVSEGIPFYRGQEISKLKRNNTIDDLLYIKELKYLEIKEKYGVPQKNDILITAVGTLGNILRVKDNKAFYFKDGNLIWLKDIKINSYFLEYLLAYEKNKILNSAIGSSQKALTMVSLNKILLNFPKDPKEQQKIADCLSSLDTLLEAQNKKVEALKKHKKGLMQQLFVNSEVSV